MSKNNFILVSPSSKAYSLVIWNVNAMTGTKSPPIKNVSFITTCKGRLDHLKQSLPLVHSLSPGEIIVVDHDCPQGTADWVRNTFPDVKVTTVRDGSEFNISRARNIGAAQATLDWIFFFDADVLFRWDIGDWLGQNLTDKNKFFRASAMCVGQRDLETYGTVLLSREIYNKLGGYDEVFSGWGGEDDDLYNRAIIAHATQSEYPNEYVQAIPHSDDDRTRFFAQKDKEYQNRVNLLYIEVKSIVIKTYGLDAVLPIEARSVIWEQARLAADDASCKSLNKSGFVAFKFDRSLTASHKIKMSMSLDFEIERVN